ncbi:ATP-binding protein [Archangium gephyra]|nr:ATP-binding protein [Archangium gephyra]
MPAASTLSEENVPLASVAVKAMAGEGGFAQEECERLELCVVEAITNVIQHAYQGAAGHPVTLAVAVTSEELELRLHDDGAPMPDGMLERPQGNTLVLAWRLPR